MKIIKTLLILSALILVIFSFVGEILKYKATKSRILVKKEVDANLLSLYATSTKVEDKIKIIKNLKEVSLDETKDKDTRIVAGQAVVGNFFDFGISLSEGFSPQGFSEREIYEYAKHINTLGDSGRNSLLTAYIGLRFYSNEIDKNFIAELIRSHKRYAEKNGRVTCGEASKLSSVLYMSKKSPHTDVTPEFGDYYASFKNAFENVCPVERRTVVGFMWLAAISDIGTSEIEESRAKWLLTYITRDTTEKSELVRNLKASYFGSTQEPDTVSIVERLMVKYPEFKVFIESIQSQ